MKTQKLPIREWVSILLIGLAGQLAWAIENNYINMWIYSQTNNSQYITWMTIFSAIAATITTFFMGVLSDRLGSRKYFIAGGYTIWGVTVFLFGLCSYQNMASAYGALNAAFAVGVWMTIIDCVMTFFGSTANDACFNARVTDVTNTQNRGKVESVLSVLPLFATILVLLISGALGAGSSLSESQQQAILAAGGDPTSLVDSAAYLAKPWLIFFIIFGVITSLIGIASFFLLPKDEIKANKETSYWKGLIYGFRPSVIKKNKNLYIALLAFMAFNMAIDAFMPYFMVYFSNPIDKGGLGLAGFSFYLDLGIILVVASVVVIVIGLFMDKIGKIKLLLPALGLAGIGFLTMYFSKESWALIISGICMMSGYLISTAVLGAEVRDETPQEEVGLFQGVRMIFAVMLPMIIGSSVCEAIMSATGGTYVNEFNETVTAPNNVMFLVSLGFLLIALAPSIWLFRRKQKEGKVNPPSVPNKTN
jgi:MFS family permease